MSEENENKVEHEVISDYQTIYELWREDELADADAEIFGERPKPVEK